MAYRATGGRIGKRLVANDMMLLTTTGRRTGARHTVPLLYLRDSDGALIVIASWGGRDRHPEWYLNLVADPRVVVQIDADRFRADAVPLREPERTEWWQRAVAAYDGYADYQAKTDRVIPVVTLRRR